MSLHVLIVEDELLIALDTQQQLEERGHTVVDVAPTVRTAMRSICRHRPDVAILDVNLKGEHVRPVADVLRARGVPFLYTTAYAHTLDEVDGVETAPVLGKPFSIHALEEAIAVVLGHGGFDVAD